MPLKARLIGIFGNRAVISEYIRKLWKYWNYLINSVLCGICLRYKSKNKTNSNLRFKLKHIERKVLNRFGKQFLSFALCVPLPKKFRRPSENNCSNPVRGALDLPVFRLLNFLTYVALNYSPFYDE